MKWARVRSEGRTRIGIVDGDSVTLLDGDDAPSAMRDVITALSGRDRGERVAAWVGSNRAMSLDDVSLETPIESPRSFLALGLNYRGHAEEIYASRGRPIRLPEAPIVFAKSGDSLTGPFDPIAVDESLAHALDHEVELAVVVGHAAHRVPRERALGHVFGYAVVNDVTARDLQERHRQYYLSKSLPRSCPMGPWIVTSDELSDPQDLSIECRVNGAVVQRAGTSDMIFGVADALAAISAVVELLPGDVIATGTPAGVGVAETPPRFLRAGDLVECTVDGIGTIANRIDVSRH